MFKGSILQKFFVIFMDWGVAWEQVRSRKNAFECRGVTGRRLRARSKG